MALPIITCPLGLLLPDMTRDIIVLMDLPALASYQPKPKSQTDVMRQKSPEARAGSATHGSPCVCGQGVAPPGLSLQPSQEGSNTPTWLETPQHIQTRSLETSLCQLEQVAQLALTAPEPSPWATPAPLCSPIFFPCFTPQDGPKHPSSTFLFSFPKFGSKILLQGTDASLLPTSSGISKADGHCTASHTARASLLHFKSTLTSTLQPREAAKSLIIPCSRTQSGLGPAVLPNGPLASQGGGRNSLITGVILAVPSLLLKAGAVLPCWLKAWVATGQSRKSHRGKLNLVSCGTESLLQPWTNPPDVSLPLLARPNPHSHTHGPSAKPSPAAPSPASADGTSGTLGDNSPR